jgi:uncharacterized surface protein with fasciclin (FAS1) repeats
MRCDKNMLNETNEFLSAIKNNKIIQEMKEEDEYTVFSDDNSENFDNDEYIADKINYDIQDINSDNDD